MLGVMLWIINVLLQVVCEKRVIWSNRIKTLSKCVIHSRFNETKLIQIEWDEIEILPTEIGSSMPQWNSFLAPPFISHFWVRLMTHIYCLSAFLGRNGPTNPYLTKINEETWNCQTHSIDMSILQMTMQSLSGANSF